jgi:poly(A) polymerase/tRNA nucleotidyltransferase (CCA-adding enzyme)
MKEFILPKEIQEIAKTLGEHGYKAYLVGGSVRDLLLHNPQKDWDITTNARPDDIQKLFPDTVYENEFGTVGIKTQSEDPTLKVVEVTTFRIEGKYSDKRHPDEVRFADTVEEDLSRRDFTVNAMAILLTNDKQLTTHNKIIDPYGGQNDLKDKIIRTVGDAEKRFQEDALRLLRAVRFSAQLSAQGGPASGWEIHKTTQVAIKKNAPLLKHIAAERIRDEFQKLIMTPRALEGMFQLEKFRLLEYIIPELLDGVGCRQNKHHVYTVFEHNVRALEYATKKNYSLEVRLASLLHDIGKPRTKNGSGENATFYNHEMVGARIAKDVLDRLKFPRDLVQKVRHLIRYHMFYYNAGEVSEAGVRRFIARVGVENIDDILRVREADRVGSKVPKAFPYKLRHLLFMIDKVRHDPVHPKMLAIKGDEVMRILNIPAGPRIGEILFVLLEEVLDNPEKNKKEYLEMRVRELGAISLEELKQLAQEGREKRDSLEEDIEEEMKKKYYVK